MSSDSESEESQSDRDLDNDLSVDDTVNDNSEDQEELWNDQLDIKAKYGSIFMASSLQAKILRKMESQHNKGSNLRKFVYLVVDSNWFSGTILSVIIINTVLIGLQTVTVAELKAGWYFSVLDQIFLGIYIIELVSKLYVYRNNYFKSGWNTFDFIIVLTSIIDVVIPAIVQNLSAFDPKIFRALRIFRAMRAIRALRVLRTIHFLKNLQVIVMTLLQSIPALGSIVLLLWLVLYIFAIIGMGLYREVDQGRFGNIARSVFSLFQLITLDDWFYMYTDVLEVDPKSGHIFFFLFIFIILETFIFINLFVAVIVDNLQNSQEQMNRKSKVDDRLGENDWDAADADALNLNAVATLGGGEGVDWLSHTHTSKRTRALTMHYLMILASLESNWSYYQTQHKVLDTLVDALTSDGGDDIS